jgi:hypothetical protein
MNVFIANLRSLAQLIKMAGISSILRQEITSSFEDTLAMIDMCKDLHISISEELVNCFENVVLDFHTERINITLLCEGMLLYGGLSSKVTCVEDVDRIYVHKMLIRAVRNLFANLVFPLSNYTYDDVMITLRLHFGDEDFRTVIPTVMLALVKINKTVLKVGPHRRRGKRRALLTPSLQFEGGGQLYIPEIWASFLDKSI